MTDYHVRVGTRRAKTPARDLYTQPSRTCRDDGAIIVHVGDHQPTCSDCGRGLLEWAEAGYVSWHRICSICGSHWDLHPITWGPARPSRDVRPASRDDAPHHADDCEIYWEDDYSDEHGVRPCTCGAQAAIDRASAEQAALLARSGGLVRWVDGRGEVPLDPDEYVAGEDSPTWGQFVALLRPEHWAAAERMAGMLVVPCAWARRARFYG